MILLLKAGNMLEFAIYFNTVGYSHF